MLIIDIVVAGALFAAIGVGALSINGMKPTFRGR